MGVSVRVKALLLGLIAVAAIFVPRLPVAGDGEALVAIKSESLTAAERAARAGVPDALWILVSIREKSLTLYHGTEVRKRYAVATGTGDTPTPIGTFVVNSRFSGDLGGFGTRFLGLYMQQH